MLAFTAGLPSVARAHPESAPALVNRYVTLATQDTTAFLSVALLFGAQPGSKVRGEADVNNDGVVDAAEQERLTESYRAQASGWLTIELNGKLVPFAPAVSVDLGPSRAVSGGAVVAEATMKLPLVAGTRHDFKLFPKAHPVPQGETEVTAVLGPGWHIATGAGQPRSVKVSGPTPADFVVSFPLEAGQRRRPPLWPWVLLTIGALGGAVGMIRRNRRR